MSSPCAMREARACLRLLGKVRSQLAATVCPLSYSLTWKYSSEPIKMHCHQMNWLLGLCAESPLFKTTTIVNDVDVLQRSNLRGKLNLPTLVAFNVPIISSSRVGSKLRFIKRPHR